MSESSDEKPKKRKYRTAAEQVADRKAEKEAIAERRRKKKRRTRDKHNHRKWRAKKRAEQTREELEAKRAEQAAARAARREQTEQEKAQIELARRELARRRLLPFIHRFNPGYLAGWFHKDLCARLEKFLDDVVNQRSPRLMLFVPPRHGKLLCKNTPVLTTAGWKRHGDLRPGDFVFGPDGTPTQVIGVTALQPADQEVELTDGTKIRCHENHEWTVFRRNYGDWVTLETKQLRYSRNGERKLFSGGRALFQLPPREPVQFPTAELEIDPYVFGAWLGDGKATGASICGAEDDLKQVVNGWPEAYPNSWSSVHKTTGVVYLGFRHMIPRLRKLGVLGNKHIPDAYKFASISQREQLLAGLIDTDGHVDKTQRIRIATVSDQLASDIEDVVRSLGWRASRYTQGPALSSSGIQGNLPVHYVSFTPDRPLPTKIPRKKVVGRPGCQRRVGIKAIRTVDPFEGNCIQVDRADGLYLAGRELVPTHNSITVSQHFPPWALGKYPHLEFIACSYAESLQIDFSKKIQELIKDPEYQLLFPGVEIPKKHEAVSRWQLAMNGKLTGGGFLAAGVGGPLTGRGAHIGLIDDPIKNAEEADSETIRNSIKNWFSSTFYTRLAPGGGILIVQTRWHDDDLSGWLLHEMQDAVKEEAETGVWPIDADRWEVISYPAIAVEDEKYRKKGEALHPERFSRELLLKTKRTMIPRHWSALYQQSPVAEEGQYFTRDMIRFYHQKNRPTLDKLDIYCAGDLAISTKESADFSVFVVAGLDKDDNLWILDVRRGRWDTDEIIEQIFDIQKTWKPIRFGIEREKVLIAIGPPLNSRIRKERLYSLVVEELQIGGRDKRARARPMQGRMKQGKVLIPAEALWVEQWVNEYLRFDSGIHDDCVDAGAWLAQMLADVTYRDRPQNKNRKSWRDKLKAHISGRLGGGSHMRA